MEYIIKKCEYEDLEEVARMYNQLARELKTSNQEEFQQSELSDNTMLRIIRSAIKECNLIIYVAKYEDEVIGFISGSEKDAFIQVTQVKQIGYIEGTYVKEEYREKKVLLQLEEELRREFKRRGFYNIEKSELESSNTATDVWASRGYQTFCEQIGKKI